MALLLVSLLAVLLFVGCRRVLAGDHNATGPADAGGETMRAASTADASPAEIRQRGHHVLGLYFVRDPGVGPLEALRRETGTTRFQLIQGKQTAERNDPSNVYMAAPDLSQAPPPSGEQLELFGRGFSPTERAQAETIAAVRVMAFSLRDAVAVRDADQLVERVAAATGAYVYDTASREIFTLAAWRSRRLSAWNGDRPIVERHVNVHAYRDGSGYRAVSLGLEKFGVPDVAVSGIRGEDLERVDTLVQLTMQSLVDQATTTLQVPTKRGDVAVRLAEARPARGDAKNRLLEVAEPLGPVLARLGDAEELRAVRADDTAIKAAVVQVQARLPALARRFAAGLGPTGRLQVKALFEREAMWLDVSTWENGEVRGRLTNHPQVATKVAAGETVRIRESEILDYQLTGVAVPEGPFLQK